MQYMAKLNDIAGQVFTYLTAVSISEHRTSDGRVIWNCLCKCGNTCLSDLKTLRRGDKKSCGCLFKEYVENRKTYKVKEERISSTKGSVKSLYKREYTSLKCAKNRCNNPNCKEYNDYGGRGISICERWMESSASFIEDMGECPEGFTLERIDVNGNYCPENCKWASLEEQSLNKRNTVKVNYDGELIPIVKLIEKTGLSRKILTKISKQNISLTSK